MLEGVGPKIVARDLANELSGATDHFVEVLDDQFQPSIGPVRAGAGYWVECPIRRLPHSQSASRMGTSLRPSRVRK